MIWIFLFVSKRFTTHKNFSQDHPINNSDYIEWSPSYRVEEGRVEPYTNFFDLNDLAEATDSQYKKTCYMGMNENDPNDPLDDTAKYEEGWKFRFEWQLPNDKLVEMI